MFSFSKSNTFKPVPFGQSRKRGSVPRWLIWSGSGLIAGAIGLYALQEKVLPPRLSTLESNSLRSKAEDATKAMTVAKSELADSVKAMKQAQGDQAKAVDKMNVALVGVDPLMKDIDLFIKALPPDPRGNPIGIRAGNFAAGGGQLTFHVLFVREAKDDSNFSGTMQIVAAGARGGRDASITLDPQPIAMDQYKHVQGKLALPADFQPREIAIKLRKGQSDAVVSQRVFRMTN